ncbi:structural maintenance of chromosomes protein 1A-like [Schistocerca piceifrons]|uniref:structural maintenance of chromosomes protein 1A-like n=1 Tax=Schistocerca piceifrons TaxID=274613 RepID=UPI001F5E6687|nr:structural maintenance of chromosomes protein 1A-like [Schistocerca piceifrons]
MLIDGYATVLLDLLCFNQNLRKAIVTVTGNVVVCTSDGVAQSIAYNENNRCDAVTLEGTLYKRSGLIVGGMMELERRSERWLSQDIIELRLQKKQLEKEVKDINLTINKRIQQKSAVETDIFELESEMSKYKALLKNIENEMTYTEQRTAQIKSNIQTSEGNAGQRQRDAERQGAEVPKQPAFESGGPGRAAAEAAAAVAAAAEESDGVGTAQQSGGRRIAAARDSAGAETARSSAEQRGTARAQRQRGAVRNSAGQRGHKESAEQRGTARDSAGTRRARSSAGRREPTEQTAHHKKKRYGTQVNIITDVRNKLAERQKLMDDLRQKIESIKDHVFQNFLRELGSPSIYVFEQRDYRIYKEKLTKKLELQEKLEFLKQQKNFELSQSTAEDLKIFRFHLSVLVPKENRLKLDSKNKVDLFMGYDNDVKGYRIFKPSTKKIEVHQDAVFLTPAVSQSEKKPDVPAIESDTICCDDRFCCGEEDIDITSESEEQKEEMRTEVLEENTSQLREEQDISEDREVSFENAEETVDDEHSNPRTL